MKIMPEEKGFVPSLFQACLNSPEAPLQVLGEELLQGLGVAAVSIWTENLRVPGALTRMVYQQKLDEQALPKEDYEVAAQVRQSQTLQSGAVRLDRRSSFHYWATPLFGRTLNYYLVLWSASRFVPAEEEIFRELGQHLTVLLDVILSSDLFNVRRVTRELQAAQFLHQQLMPSITSLQVDSFLAYRTLPMHELGGDYLDILRYPDGTLGLTVADAMGSGLPAAFVVLMARTIFRLLTKAATTPSEVMAELNNHFVSEVANLDTFVTQFYGVFDPRQNKLIYANAGHNPPVVLRRSSGRVTFLPGRGVALGGMLSAEYSLFSTELEEGDILLIYSDGLKEARDEMNKPFGLEGISRTLMRYKEYSADGICDGLVSSVMRHSSVQTDDISFIVLKM